MTMFQRQGYKPSDKREAHGGQIKICIEAIMACLTVLSVRENGKRKKYKYQNRSQPSRDTRVKPPQYTSRNLLK